MDVFYIRRKNNKGELIQINSPEEVQLSDDINYLENNNVHIDIKKKTPSFPFPLKIENN